MLKKKIILFLGGLLFIGCSNKNPHSGLYNALFMDYNTRLNSLEKRLVKKDKNEVLLKNIEKEIEQNINQKKVNLNFQKKVEAYSLDKFNLQNRDSEKLKKIKKIIRSMKNRTNKNYKE